MRLGRSNCSGTALQSSVASDQGCVLKPNDMPRGKACTDSCVDCLFRFSSFILYAARLIRTQDAIAS